MIDKWMLDGHTPIRAESLEQWAKWYENFENRRVASDQIGPSRISTVFLTIDHQFGEGPPLLFETMVFGGQLDDETERYSTWDEAVAGHAAMCERVRSSVSEE